MNAQRRSFMALIVILAGVVLLASSLVPVLAQTSEPPFPIELTGGKIVYSSPTLANIDDNPDDLEIIVGGEDGMVYAYKANGTLLWQVDVGLGVQSAPAVGDITGDGQPEVLVGASDHTCIGPEINQDGGLYALDRNGNLLWTFKPQDICEGGDGYADGVRASPTLGDMDNDGKLDIVIGSWDHHLYVLTDNGTSTPTKQWEFRMPDTIWSSPALADMNGDGYLDIVVGGHKAWPWEEVNGQPVTGDGTIWLLDYHNRRRFDGFPIGTSMVVWSGPAVGDINNDGVLELVIGTGINGEGGQEVYAYTANAQPVPGWPVATPEGCFTSPALGDFENDGNLEIVIGCENSRIYAFRSNGQAVPGWEGGIEPRNARGGVAPFIRSSPIIADYDGDGQVEVIFGFGFSVVALATDGTQETADGTGSGKPDFDAGLDFTGSPAIADIDSDGNLELVVGSSFFHNMDHGYLYVWQVGAAASARTPWPQFQRNQHNTALLTEAHLSASVDRLTVVLAQQGYGQTASRIVRFTQTGSEPLTWEASLSDQHGIVSLNHSTGSTADTLTLNFRLPDGMMNGSYTAALMVQPSNSDEPFQIPIDIQVVDDLNLIMLPFIGL